MIKKVLGFDVSSTTIGIALVSVEIETAEVEMLEMDHIKPLKEGSLVSRLADTRNQIKHIIEQAQPDYICIEDILLFVAGRSSANTITLLASFNRMVCLLAFDYLGTEPHLYSATAIRNGLRTKYETPAKEEMPDLIADHFNFQFPWMYGKKGKIEVENYDRADAAAAALFDAFVLSKKVAKIENYHFKIKKPAKKKKRKVRR
jgi:Holliday junction resolvasome RuvABC endonuclease subunit